MGMFDNVKCKFPLPKGFEKYQNTDFQTKDTPEQMLVDYVIEKNGRLTEFPYSLESYTKIRNDATTDPLDALSNSFRRVNHPPREIYYHGELVFYGYDRPKTVMAEFTAYFAEGRCIFITGVT